MYYISVGFFVNENYRTPKTLFITEHHSDHYYFCLVCK